MKNIRTRIIFIMLISLVLGASAIAQENSLIKGHIDFKGLESDLEKEMAQCSSIDSWSLSIARGSRPIDKQPLFLVIGFVPDSQIRTINEVLGKVRTIVASASSLPIEILSRYRWKISVALPDNSTSRLLEAIKDDLDRIEQEYLDMMLVIKKEIDFERSSFDFYLCTYKAPTSVFRKELEEEIKGVVGEHGRQKE